MQKETITFETGETVEVESSSTTDIEKQREEALRKQAEQAVTINKAQLEICLKENAVNYSSEELHSFDFSNAKKRFAEFRNETVFAITSMFEGFLSIYGVEVDKALTSYENQLAVIEQTDFQGETSISVGRILRNGKTKILNTGYQTREQAKQAIQKFRTAQQKKEEVPKQEQQQQKTVVATQQPIQKQEKE